MEGYGLRQLLSRTRRLSQGSGRRLYVSITSRRDEDIDGPRQKQDSTARHTSGQEDSPSVPALKQAQLRYPCGV